MFLSGLGLRADRVLLGMVDEARQDPRYTIRDHVWYGTDDAGRVTVDGFKARGGHANNPERAATTPFTLADRDRVRRELRGLGLALTADQVDALLLEADRSTDGGDPRAMVDLGFGHNALREDYAARKRRQREEWRARGFCTMRNKGCAGDTPLAAGRKTCDACSAGGAARRRKSRESAR